LVGISKLSEGPAARQLASRICWLQRPPSPRPQRAPRSRGHDGSQPGQAGLVAWPLAGSAGGQRRSGCSRGSPPAPPPARPPPPAPQARAQQPAPPHLEAGEVHRHQRAACLGCPHHLCGQLRPVQAVALAVQQLAAVRPAARQHAG
jgi:hypothetical protein